MLLPSSRGLRFSLPLLLMLSPGLALASNPAPPPTTPPPSSTPPPTGSTPLPAGQSGFWELSGNLVSHDPTIIKERNTWYLMQTGPGIGGKYSHDGLYWNPLAPVFPRPLSWWSRYVPDNRNNDVWAPELKRFNGRVWLYYSISTFGSQRSLIGLASAPSVESGQWRDEGLVIRTTSADNYNAIDPDMVIDASGNPWLALGSWNSGIKITRLDRSTMKPTGRLYSIAARGNGIEAPTVVYRDGYYYLFVSVGRCCAGLDSTYTIVYGRSRNITGPYLDRNGTDMMRGGGSVLDRGNNRWVGPGGQDIYDTNVIVRHAYDGTDNGTPKMLINTLHWDSAGWPRY
ncbi:glycoside hydrolase family 43 protein [Halopseudomonas sp.]|uniref:glycoside hydrolase family 43 protein n=1 Tax=Halopseudomonas sp. TaxID=2901191 RepID=UPI001A5D7D89|nr:glycoside hydrolase family 43 protein [Pseudomonas sp.]